MVTVEERLRLNEDGCGYRTNVWRAFWIQEIVCWTQIHCWTRTGLHSQLTKWLERYFEPGRTIPIHTLELKSGHDEGQVPKASVPESYPTPGLDFWLIITCRWIDFAYSRYEDDSLRVLVLSQGEIGGLSLWTLWELLWKLGRSIFWNLSLCNNGEPRSGPTILLHGLQSESKEKHKCCGIVICWTGNVDVSKTRIRWRETWLSVLCHRWEQRGKCVLAYGSAKQRSWTVGIRLVTFTRIVAYSYVQTKPCG